MVTGWPLCPGRHVGEWSLEYHSYSWQLNGHDDPHAPSSLESWTTEVKARFMQCRRLNDNGTYSPLDEPMAGHEETMQEPPQDPLETMSTDNPLALTEETKPLEPMSTNGPPRF